MFEIELIICIKIDLALNNLQRLICHKTQTTKPNNHLHLFFSSFCLFIVNFSSSSSIFSPDHSLFSIAGFFFHPVSLFFYKPLFSILHIMISTTPAIFSLSFFFDNHIVGVFCLSKWCFFGHCLFFIVLNGTTKSLQNGSTYVVSLQTTSCCFLSWRCFCIVQNHLQICIL